jgi:hypothetical protein
MKLRRYKRTMVIEQLRQLGRIVDFLLLLVALRIHKQLPALSRLHKTTFVELGPGPTRLARVKKVLFQKILFVDQSDFGVPCPDLRVIDLEKFEDAERLFARVRGGSSNEPVFLFADHCMEHLSESALLAFLKSAIDFGFLACFRVPNVLSPRGKRNFLGDSTHLTSFDPQLRERIGKMGLAISPWIRWYKVRLIFKALILREPLMDLTEEIAIYTFPQSGNDPVLDSWNVKESRK